jgi:hypothetical protein
MGRQYANREARKAPYFLRIAAVALLAWLIPLGSSAGEVGLSWDPPAIATDVAGYKVYHGSASGSYSAAEDAGNQLAFRVKNLPGILTYYFAVTAYNAAGYESVFSNEVFVALAPDPARNLRIEGE